MFGIDDILGGVTGIASGLIASKTAKDNAKMQKEMHEADIAEQNRRFQESTLTNRPDQHSAFGDLTWTKDPTTGAWTQTNKMNAADEANLNKYRGVQSQQLDRAARPYTVDWDSVGLGKFAKAAGVGDWKSGGGLGSGSNWMVQTASPGVVQNGMPPGEQGIGQAQQYAASQGLPPGATGRQASRMPVVGTGMPGGEVISEQQAGGMAPIPNVPQAPAQDPAALAAALRKQQEDELRAQAQSSGGGAMPFAGGANMGGGA